MGREGGRAGGRARQPLQAQSGPMCTQDEPIANCLGAGSLSFPRYQKGRAASTGRVPIQPLYDSTARNKRFTQSVVLPSVPAYPPVVFLVCPSHDTVYLARSEPRFDSGRFPSWPCIPQDLRVFLCPPSTGPFTGSSFEGCPLFRAHRRLRFCLCPPEESSRTWSRAEGQGSRRGCFPRRRAPPPRCSSSCDRSQPTPFIPFTKQKKARCV